MEPLTIVLHDYTITTDKELMRQDDIFNLLTENAYWYTGTTYATFETAFQHSFCVGILFQGRQIGYARLITDYAIFGYLADVCVAPEHRGKGLSKKMLDMLIELDWVKKLRGIKLQTKEAHSLYAQYGFAPCANPERIMELSRPVTSDKKE